jgi:hypothetical protein
MKQDKYSKLLTEVKVEQEITRYNSFEFRVL